MNVVDPVPALEQLVAAAARAQKQGIRVPAITRLRVAAAQLAEAFRASGDPAFAVQVAKGLIELTAAISAGRHAIPPSSRGRDLARALDHTAREIRRWVDANPSITKVPL